MTIDDSDKMGYLKVISILYYVLGGITALGSLIPIVHVVVGIAIFMGGMQRGGDAPPAAFGLLFAVFGLIFIICGMAVAVCCFLAAVNIGKLKKHRLCVICAAVSCIITPLGTALGVFALVTLLNDRVKQMFIK